MQVVKIYVSERWFFSSSYFIKLGGFLSMFLRISNNHSIFLLSYPIKLGGFLLNELVNFFL